MIRAVTVGCSNCLLGYVEELILGSSLPTSEQSPVLSKRVVCQCLFDGERSHAAIFVQVDHEDL